MIAAFLAGILLFTQTWTNCTTSGTSTNFPSNTVFAIIVDDLGTKWFGTRGGISKFDGNDWTTFTQVDGFVNNLVNAVIIVSPIILWIKTDGGVLFSRVRVFLD